MYQCESCKKKFKDFKILKTSYESYYGVASLFSNSKRLELQVCPYCESEEIKKCKKD